MEAKSCSRRKFPLGFSPTKDSSGMMQGHATLLLPRRNAYQLIGLRRPAREPGLRIKVM
jgi:hypothetical protein